MKNNKTTYCIHSIIRNSLLTLLIFGITSFGNVVLGDGLTAVANKGTSSTTASGTWTTVTSQSINIGSNTTDVDRVMVVATFSVEPQNSNAHQGIFRLADLTNTVESNEIIRTLERVSTNDNGIGSLVYIFDVSGYSGDITYALQHTTNNSSWNNDTDGTITIIALGTTTSHTQLSNDMKSITAPVPITTANTYETVTGLESSVISLPVTGSIYVAASVNSDLTTGTTQTGTWKIQIRRGTSGTWEDIGNEISRSMSNNTDYGIASLGLVLTSLPSDDYYFRLQHKSTDDDLQTLNTNLIAVALAYDDATLGGRAFPAFNIELENTSAITSGNLADACSKTGSPPEDNTSMFVYAQYNLQTSAMLDAPCFDIQITDGDGFTYNSQTEYRSMSSSSDIGSGASVGLANGLMTSGSYTASLRHAATGTLVTLTTKSIILSGFQTKDQPAEGYWMGGTSTDWNNTANWANSTIPISATSITIYSGKSNDPVIGATTSATCNDLFIESGATLTIESTSESSTGSLIIEGTATGDVTVERYLTNDRWHYIAGQANISGNFDELSMGLVGTADNDQFYRWEEDLVSGIDIGFWVDILNGEDGTGDNTLMDEEGFIVCKGYAINYGVATTPQTISFSGVPYTSTQTISITKTTGSTNEGTNLIGNPFASTIALNTGASTDNFIADNIGVLDDTYGGVYLWNEKDNYVGNRNDYYTVSLSEGTEFAAPGQGFMIVTDITSGGVATFDENIRKHGSSTFYKGTKQDEVTRFYMSVENNEGLYNEILIAFIEGMTKGLDPSYDAGKLKGNPNIALYTNLVEDNGVDFAHQALPPLDDEVVRVKTGLDVSTAGNYTFKIKELQNFDEAISIKLEDKVTGSLIDFHQDEEYSFFINTPGEIRERFVLHFNGVTGIEDDEHITKATIQTYGFNNTLYTLNPQKKQGTVTIYNLTGQKVVTYKLTGEANQQQILNVVDVINVVKIQTGDEALSKKVIFR